MKTNSIYSLLPSAEVDMSKVKLIISESFPKWETNHDNEFELRDGFLSFAFSIEGTERNLEIRLTKEALYELLINKRYQ